MTLRKHGVGEVIGLDTPEGEDVPITKMAQAEWTLADEGDLQAEAQI